MTDRITITLEPMESKDIEELMLDPSVENKGIGTKVWKMIEEMYPDTLTWSTETPIFSRRNHNFYINKCGFHCVKIDNPKNFEEGQFVLKKVMK